MAKNLSERHHYVPEMLSKRFADETGKLWYFEQSNARHGLAPRTPRGAFWKTRLNTVEDSGGCRDTSAEEIFGANEDRANRLLDWISLKLRAGRSPMLSPAQRGDLDLFVHFQFKRPPDRFAAIAQIDEATIRGLIEYFEVELGAKLLEEDVRALLTGKPTTQVHQNGAVRATTHIAQEVMAVLEECGLFFGVVKGGRAFAIGSNPILRVGGRLGTPGAMLLLPIASDLVIGYGQTELHGQLRPWPSEKVLQFNREIWAQSTSIGARSKGLIEKLAHKQLKAARRV